MQFPNAPNRPANGRPVVLLDLMSTLIPDPFFPAVEKLAGNLQKFAAIKNINAYLDFEHGRLSEEEYMQSFFKNDAARQKATFSPEQFRAELLRTPQPFDFVRPFLDKNQTQCAFYLASNYSIWLEHHWPRLKLEPYFTGVFASYLMGQRKPSPEFFEYIRQSLDVDYDQMIFVDDQPKNIDGAQTLGIATVQADGTDWTGKTQMLINKMLGG